MQEIGAITEYSNEDEHLVTKKDKSKDDIEIGLEIVTLEMGRILEELKDNLDQLSQDKDTGEIIKEADEKKTAKAQKLNKQDTRKISDKFQQQPHVKNNSRNSISSVSNSSKQQVSKPNYQAEKNNFIKKPNNRTRKKPNYQVHKSNYAENYEKLTNVHTDKVNTVQKNHSISDNQKSVNADKVNVLQQNFNTNNNQKSVTANKINTKQQNLSSFSGLSQRKLTVPVIHVSSRSSKSSTTSNLVTYCPLRRSPLRTSNQIIRQPSLCCKSSIFYDTLRKLKEQVETAVRERKTFTVCGNYYTIRRALLTRGWVEKIRILYNTYDRDNLKRLQSTSIQQLLEDINDPQNSYVYKRMIMSKLLGQHQVDFYWDQNFDCFRICRDNIKLTLVNRFRRGIFSYTSKQGLCESMKRAHWYNQPGSVSVRHPRSYNLSNKNDPKEFINDFKLTAAMSLLKWIVKNQENCHNNRITSTTGKVPLAMYDFAIAELSKAVRKCKHEDIDYEIEDALDYHWNEFLESFYKIVHIGSRFKTEGRENVQKIVKDAKNTLEKIEEFWPHLKMDGMMNIWILKPTNGSRGEGIYLCRTLQYILKIIKSNTTRRYIVQKYIERPLLIHNTKFDIRQWFLISSAVPLTIWIYKDSYVRFSSQLYSLRKLHESIHLTNNSVQSRYKNCNRHPALPACNMWDSNQFQKYLTSIGHPNVFMKIIYPGIKECITGAILMNQNNLDTRKNCFELYGSDFMITEDFKPWLIEINSRPALYPSTPITARMCPQVLDDVIKVIIDYPKNSKTPTGHFELLYKEEIEKLPKSDPDNLKLQGQQLPMSYFYTPEFTKDDHLQRTSSSNERIECTHHNIKQISSEMKKTLENLLSLIQAERERRKQLKNQFSQVSNITQNDTNKLETKTDENGDNNKNSSAVVIIDTEDNDKTTLKVIKSVATNLKIAESSITTMATENEQIVMEDAPVRRTLNVNINEIDEAVKEKSPKKANNSKGIFKDIIDSIRNLTLVYKSTVQK